MRALRVVGLADGGKTVICEDPARGERFTLPADERLRAAARGDLTRLGQIEIELESQMRPREIQARIRAGESVEQVAEAAGIPAQKVERFAYPVLLERSRTADLAQRAHPVREDGPDVQTLGEAVVHAFTLRGQDYAAAAWDSWRGEDGKWIVQLGWQAGRSYNRAHWSFHPGARGGTVTPLDEHARDLLDPQPNRPLRTVRPVTELAQAALNLDQASPPRPPDAMENTAPAPVPVPIEPESEPDARTARDFVEDFELTAPAGAPEQVVEEPPPAAPAAMEPAPATPAAVEPTAAEPAAADPTAAESTEVDPPAEPPVDLPADEPAAVVEFPDDDPIVPAPATEEPAPATAEEGGDKPETPRRTTKAKKNRPIVPSWEDVLLGTRSNRG